MRRTKQETISDFCYLLSINNVLIIVANSRDFYLSVLASFGLIIQVSSVGNAMQGFLGLVYTACYKRTELIIYVARSGTLVACIFYLYVTTVSEPNCILGEIKYVLNYNKL